MDLVPDFRRSWSRSLLLLCVSAPFAGCQNDSHRYEIITQLIEKDQSDIIGSDNVMIFDRKSGTIYSNECPSDDICKSYQWQKKVSFDTAVRYPAHDETKK